MCNRKSLACLLLFLIANQPLRASEPEFSVDVMSVLSKAGCNSGGCHGNLNGKGGLKLSLRGEDPAYDYQAMALASRGRRIHTGIPELSLILQKACGQVAHGGGLRFEPDSAEYAVLHAWIMSGARPPRAEAAQVLRLEVTPSASIVADPGNALQVHVQAHFSDGSLRNITDRACYELSNLNARVSASGLVEREKFGETTLVVRYLDQQVAVPIGFIAARPDFAWSAAPQNNFVDQHIFEKLERMRLNPSPLTVDHVFVRRAYLDAIGRAPSADEARAFVFDDSADKRSRLIDALLERPEFSDYWALKWADILRTEEKVLDPTGVDRFHAWVRESIASSKPLDAFVRELVTGVGSTFEQPAANYYRANRDPATRGETTARLFLGIRIQCAKCHNHPFDRWTQDDYYRWSSLFSQLSYDLGENKRTDNLDKNEFAGDQIVLISKQDEVVNPTTGRKAEPQFLGGQPLGDLAPEERLDALAQWLTAADNELFAKSQVNFVWYHLMGSGLVDPIDDFRLTNPASNPELLNALAKHFIESQFNLRELVRTIMNSRTYQLSAEPNETNAEDSTCYSHASVRRLPAEVLLDAQSDVLGLAAEFGGFERGIRAVQIPGVERVRRRKSAGELGDRFLKTFGKPERIMACDCERSNETTLKQAFVLLGNGLNERLSEKGSWLEQISASPISESELLDELYWRTLSRPPSEVELEATLASLRAHSAERLAVVQDIAWALMNAKEFLFRR